MLNRSIGRRGVAIVALALLALALAAQISAALRSLSVSPTRTRATGELFTVEGAVICQTTLEKELSARIGKFEGLQMGTVTGTFGRCSPGGTFRFLNETPARLIYISFSGTLPSIAEIKIRIQGLAFSIIPTIGEPCLYRGDVLLTGVISAGAIRTLTLERQGVPLFRGNPIICLRVALSGTLTQEPAVGVRLL